MSQDPLIAAATAVREKAFAPFSHFKVGAALETENGTIIPGCNVESASYGLTMCAERAAIFRGVADGFRCFKRVAIVTDTLEPTFPCGACRQLLWEFARDAEVIVANLAGRMQHRTVAELIPDGFDARHLVDVPG